MNSKQKYQWRKHSRCLWLTMAMVLSGIALSSRSGGLLAGEGSAEPATVQKSANPAAPAAEVGAANAEGGGIVGADNTEGAGPGELGAGDESNGIGESGEDGTPKVKAIKDMTLDELLAFQGYHFQPMARDPFVFRRPKIKKKTRGDSRRTDETSIKTADVRPPKEEIRARLLNEVFVIETELVVGRYRRVVEIGKSLREYFDKIGGAPIDATNKGIWNDILKYVATAMRLQKAKETKEEFESINIKVTGIRWTPLSAEAVITTDLSRIYEPGAFLKGMPRDEQAQVEFIEENAVIFVFKGFKFRKQVTVDASLGTP